MPVPRRASPPEVRREECTPRATSPGRAGASSALSRPMPPLAVGVIVTRERPLVLAVGHATTDGTAHEPQPDRHLNDPVSANQKGAYRMTAPADAQLTLITRPAVSIRRSITRWARFCLMIACTAIVLAPIGGVVILSLRPGPQSHTSSSITLENFSYVFQHTQALRWLGNSLAVTIGTSIAPRTTPNKYHNLFVPLLKINLQ